MPEGGCLKDWMPFSIARSLPFLTTMVLPSFLCYMMNSLLWRNKEPKLSLPFFCCFHWKLNDMLLFLRRSYMIMVISLCQEVCPWNRSLCDELICVPPRAPLWWCLFPIPNFMRGLHERLKNIFHRLRRYRRLTSAWCPGKQRALLKRSLESNVSEWMVNQVLLQNKETEKLNHSSGYTCGFPDSGK